jgi:integrase
VHTNLSETFNSETHAYNWLQSLETYVFPHFGKKTVDKVGSPDVLGAIGPIWNTVPDTAARILRRIKAVFDWCLVSGYRTILVNGMPVTMPNPCEAIRMALPKQKRVENHHEALPYTELPAFIEAMRKTNSSVIVKLAFEFLILTVARTSEVLLAQWDEFDFEGQVWSIPADRMKMKQPHRVPLSDHALEILRLAQQFNDAEMVFPGRNAGEPLSNMAFLMTLRRMGHETLTAHGFRATFKTWAEERTQHDSLVIEASLAHAVRGIERHYLRTTFFEKREKLMQQWANFATATPSAKVVKMR